MFYCRHHLGRFWTAETSLVKEHQIIDSGPYHFIRHPIYTFALVMYVGLALGFHSVWSLFLVGIICAVYIFKTKDEDTFLEKNLSGYQEYKSRVRFRLFPGLW
jgi:protein-S-isoprenylcysteine O-methyltransferase Ste14